MSSNQVDAISFFSLSLYLPFRINSSFHSQNPQISLLDYYQFEEVLEKVPREPRIGWGV